MKQVQFHTLEDCEAFILDGVFYKKITDVREYNAVPLDSLKPVKLPAHILVEVEE